MTDVSQFPTPEERYRREVLAKALTEHEWVNVAFLWRSAYVPEAAKRQGEFMAVNVTQGLVELGPFAMTASLLFGGEAHDVRVPYVGMLMLFEARPRKLIQSFMGVR